MYNRVITAYAMYTNVYSLGWFNFTKFTLSPLIVRSLERENMWRQSIASRVCTNRSRERHFDGKSVKHDMDTHYHQLAEEENSHVIWTRIITLSPSPSSPQKTKHLKKNRERFSQWQRWFASLSLSFSPSPTVIQYVIFN